MASKRDKEKKRVYDKKYRKKYSKTNKGKESATRYYKNNKIRLIAVSREYRYKRLYNLTIEQYEELNIKQGGACAICKRIPDSRLFVDHDHITGKTRGLLCNRCNTAIAALGDNIEGLETALRYLEACL